MTTDYVIYELNGKTRDAVKKFHELISKEYSAEIKHELELRKKRVLSAQQDSPGPVTDCEFRNMAQAEKRIRLSAYYNAKAKDPSSASALGFSDSTIQIESHPAGVLRAYKVAPVCFRHPFNENKIYMYCPIDYKGRHYVPGGKIMNWLFHSNRKLDSKEAGLIGMGLSMNDAPSVMELGKYGVALPKDFNPQKHRVSKRASIFNENYRFFKAGGKTLELLAERESRRENYKKTTDKLLLVMNNIIKNDLIPEGFIKGATDPEKIYMSSSIGTNDQGRPELSLSIRKKSDGATYTISPNAYFTPEPGVSHGEYRIVPHPKTAGGLALQSFIDAVPDRKNDSFPQELLSESPDGEYDTPIIKELSEGTYLAVKTHPGLTSTEPPGSQEISAAEFIRLLQDHNDQNNGVTPPPAPKQPCLNREESYSISDFDPAP